MVQHARNPSRKAVERGASAAAATGPPGAYDALQTLPTHSAHAGVHVACDLLRFIFRSVTDGVFTIDRNFVITSFNPAAERITGFSAREALGKRCFEVLRADVCHRRCVLRETLTTEDSVENVRVTIIAQDGIERPIVLNATILRDDRGEVVGAVEFFRDLRDMEHLQQHLAHENALQRIVRGSPAMNRILEMLPNIAASDCSVLIVGPSGSGKELIAQAIHSLSPRRFGPYVRLNCAALPATLLESELFGYEKGAFTDARRDKPGHFALANGGTLLLDEITEMDPALQVKLLRVLNNGEYQPLGSTKALRTDARIIASTNADIPAALRSGRLREDLYFRINVLTVELPPLRERREDIPLLVEHFLNKLAAKTGKPIRSISPRAIGCLCRHSFPGNVRELENAIEHAFVMCQGETIEAEHLPMRICEGSEPHGPGPEAPDEWRLIEQALRRHRGNRTRAAEELGMHRSTLWRKLKCMGPES
jgi:PAS domain S-box-containing protein